MLPPPPSNTGWGIWTFFAPYSRITPGTKTWQRTWWSMWDTGRTRPRPWRFPEVYTDRAVSQRWGIAASLPSQTWSERTCTIALWLRTGRWDRRWERHHRGTVADVYILESPCARRPWGRQDRKIFQRWSSRCISLRPRETREHWPSTNLEGE
jgi:hypothetical protein